ncbi:MAG: TetR/AcrR family transcriptional regulator [Acidimicrobiales bacterium]|nr:MAG: TetR/AcrR family transcriptional regulator [Acidimicrobiales bacterium]
MTDDVLATDGRVIGERAAATRQRLLDATVMLLRRDGVLDLRVVDITREAGAAPATFYQYFLDLDAAILALAEIAIDAEAPLVDFLQPPWTSGADRERSAAFVEAYGSYWREHYPVLVLRNLKADEGDVAYRSVRSRANLLLLRHMAAMVTAGQEAQRVSTSLDPFATAAAMMAMLDQLFAYQNELRRRGSSRAAQLDTLTTILFQTLSGIVD